MNTGTNILTLTDSYKTSHYKQYPPNTEKVFSYFESRGGLFDSVVFYGLQPMLMFLESVRITTDKINSAEKLIDMHMGKGIFNRKGWEYIRDAHDGKLPIIIKAVAEGTVVPVGNALMTVENTDNECYWLTNYLETYLSQVWYPCTVATLSREIKKLILANLEHTGTPELIDFKLHDFGYRGSSSVQSAVIGGSAHLINFKGTDTMGALEYIQEFYSDDNFMAGFSIPAAEHSTITAWGRDNEVVAFENMLNQYPTGLVAIVSDSYDIYTACRELWGRQLRDKVLNREDGFVVIRPDSGEPTEVIMKILEILGNAFGHSTNDKGYKVLHPKIRIIQGDGVDIDSIRNILFTMKCNGWSGDNVAFGMGGGLLQKVNRDTQKFAFKCSSVTISGKEVDVYKQPIDMPWKQSKAGRLKTIKISTAEGISWITVPESTPPHTHMRNMLHTVFLNGQMTEYITFNNIRDNAGL